jgi:cbb3-type cytochrome oxidase subunit 3
MGLKAWIYFGFTALLTGVLIGIMIYFFRRKRKDRVESPKYRMMEDEDTSTRSQAPNSK